MAKAKINGFIKLDREFVQSEKWQTLSAAARSLLIEIWALYNGYNNGDIPYGIRQAAKSLGCGKSTAMRKFAELEQAGLIEATRKASFTLKHAAGE